MSRMIRIDVEYDGTLYHGWQRQVKVQSVQQTIEEALEGITKEYHPVVAASRTDSGVHALNQVAHFWTTTKIPNQKLHKALNTELPQDIVVKKLIRAPKGFHSMKGAHSKIYSYLIENGAYPSAHIRKISWWIPRKLDVKKMQEACKYFEGEKDFVSLKSGNSEQKSTTRTIYKIEVERKGDLIRILVHGNGFLKYMVRAIVGILTKVGRNKLDPSAVKSIIESRLRTKAAPNAPSKGLCLIKVFYEAENIDLSKPLNKLCKSANPLTFYH